MTPTTRVGLGLVGNAGDRVELLRAVVKRLLSLLDHADPNSVEWHARVRCEVENINRQYPVDELQPQ